MKDVRACIITGFGINADRELQSAFSLSGAEAKLVHIRDIIQNPGLLDDYHIIGFPGGFSYGDHIGSGKVFAGLFKMNLKQALDDFIKSGRLVIGICNGFQVLIKMGILPNLKGDWSQDATLIHNDSGKFEDRWVRLCFNPDSGCIWTRGIHSLDCPVRHGEGKFVVSDDSVLQTLKDNNLITACYSHKKNSFFNPDAAVTYPDNPNGSAGNIAGICDPTGRVLGLMPHPEAFLYPQNHPQWKNRDVTPGLAVFENAIQYTLKKL